jgi:hypothetical protein
MSTKMITLAAGAILLASTAFASAQTMSNPRPYWGGYGYNGYSYYGGPTVTFGVGPGYGPGYYNYAPGYYDNGYYDRWNDRYDWQ